MRGNVLRKVAFYDFPSPFKNTRPCIQLCALLLFTLTLTSCSRGFYADGKNNGEVIISPGKSRLLIEGVKIGDHKNDVIARFGKPDKIEKRDGYPVLYVMTYYIKKDAFYEMYFGHGDRVIGMYSQLKPLGAGK